MAQPDDTVVMTAQDLQAARGMDASMADDDSQVLVHFQDGRELWVPREALAQQANGDYYLPVNRMGSGAASRPADQANGQAGQTVEQSVIPVIEESLDVRKRKVETGVVRVTKTVEQREEVVNTPVIREEAEVRRVPVNQIIAQPAAVREEGDTIIIPLMEEVLVVEKKLMLKEELHITRKRTETHEEQRVTLRAEKAHVERVNSQE